MTTRTEQSELFAAPTRRHAAKDALLVALVAAITAGFLAHAWRPSERINPASVTPAVFLAER
jgi:hypothetical protein